MDLEYFRDFSSLKVNRCLYFILIFAHYEIMLMFCVHYFKEINMNFDITTLTKSRIKNNSASPINIELKNYRHIATEEAVF